MFLMSTSLSQFTEIYLSIGMPLRFISREAITCMFDRLQLMIQSGFDAADLRPGRGLIVAGQRIREELQVEAFLRRQRLQNADRLLSERVVDIEKRDLDALQVAAGFLL